MFTTDSFAHGQKTLNIQTLTFNEHDPGPHQTTKYGIYDLFGVRKYASGDHINHLSVFGLK